ncbi:unnamed protein product [Phytomonas sp. Hart1]|nr:unnamed protein product [Phytomonas sp. Hart1]|eukprot:CCW67004.1 unnamed protein product [Phytomonas sp. isolate Hart1]
MSGLLEIVQSQPIFQGHLRDTISAQIQQTKLSLKPERRHIRSLMDKSSSVATTHSVVLEGGQQVSNVGEVTVFEGFIKKQSQCVNWKRRYLCIRAELYHSEDGDSNTPKLRNATLFLTISKETLAQQCIPTPFSDIEDAFPVPLKYTGTNTPHVFAVACTTGKRMLFQAKSDEERDIWMANIQDMLGIGDNYPYEQPNYL